MSGAGGTIRIVYAYLETLESNARQTAQSLDESSMLSQLTFTQNQPVQNEFDHFMSRWDRNRGDIRDGVAGAADAFLATLQAFQQAEAEQVKALGESEAGPTF